jgi:hypothetical protein
MRLARYRGNNVVAPRMTASDLRAYAGEGGRRRAQETGPETGVRRAP